MGLDAGEIPDGILQERTQPGVETAEKDLLTIAAATTRFLDRQQRFPGASAAADEHARIVTQTVQNDILLFGQAKQFFVRQADAAPHRRAQIEVAAQLS